MPAKRVSSLASHPLLREGSAINFSGISSQKMLRAVLLHIENRLEFTHDESVRYAAIRVQRRRQTLYMWLSQSKEGRSYACPPNSLDLLRIEEALLDYARGNPELYAPILQTANRIADSVRALRGNPRITPYNPHQA